MVTPDEPARLLRNWRDELDSAALYAALAQIERDPQQQGVYRELESAERQHAAFWEERLRAAGQTIPPFRVALRTRILIQLARRLGIGFVVPSVIVREMKDRDAYADQQDAEAARSFISRTMTLGTTKPMPSRRASGMRIRVRRAA